MDSQKHQQFAKICQQNKWKCTSQRLIVYDFVNESKTHPRVDEVWDNVKQILPTVTRESVYRILNEFTECGILHRLDHIERARYDSRTTPHGHFICEHCGEIIDFAMPNNSTFSTPTIGGAIRHVELRVCGLCEKCHQHCPPKNKPGENHAQITN